MLSSPVQDTLKTIRLLGLNSEDGFVGLWDSGCLAVWWGQKEDERSNSMQFLVFMSYCMSMFFVGLCHSWSSDFPRVVLRGRDVWQGLHMLRMRPVRAGSLAQETHVGPTTDDLWRRRRWILLGHT